jgi:RHS repeat-associated protein
VEMRTALDQALGAPSPAYAAGLAFGQPIKKDHIQELRDRVLAAWNSGAGGVDIRWLVTDQLGTPRMIFDQTGSLANTKRHDYLPFGEELGGQGGRTTALGYAADIVRQKFTQKERDNETGLDYFGARYYASTAGRFTGTDPKPVTKESFLNPQRWNQYVFVNNNPMGSVDLNGADGEGKAGDKVISVFLDYGVKSLGTRVTTDSSSGKVTSAVPNTSDWQGTSEAAARNGYRVDFYGSSDVTGNKGLPHPSVSDISFENALRTSDLVLYLGHGRGDPSTEPFQQQGIQVGQTLYTPAGSGSASPTATVGAGPFTGQKPEVTASVVANFSCDANPNGGSYFSFVGQNQVMVTVDSRGDGRNGGITTYDALDKAANAFVKTYARTGDTLKAVEAANKVLGRIPGNQKENEGDKIRQKKVD